MRLIVNVELVTDDNLVTHRTSECTLLSNGPCDCYESDSEEMTLNSTSLRTPAPRIIVRCHRCGAVWIYKD